MGAALPLPERVPRVTRPEERNLLEQAGVQLDWEAQGQYVPYKLPQGWRMVDGPRWRGDFPNFLIVDAANRIHFKVGGVWKGAYDNVLRWTFCEQPLEEYVPEDDSVENPKGRLNTTELATIKIMDAVAGNRT